MAMRQPSFHKASIKASQEPDDWSGIDVWIEDLPIAYRRRFISIMKYGQISIRRHLYFYSEYNKILNGKFNASLYIFEFDDAFVICRTVDIRACLEMKLDDTVPNPDFTTEGHYLNLDALPHLLIYKEA